MLQVVHHLFRDTKTVEEKKLFFKLFICGKTSEKDLTKNVDSGRCKFRKSTPLIN
jgi:hypothetical protein